MRNNSDETKWTILGFVWDDCEYRRRLVDDEVWFLSWVDERE